MAWTGEGNYIVSEADSNWTTSDLSGFLEWSDTTGVIVTVSDTTVLSTRISGKADSGLVAYLAQAETIAGNWVNTTNPWADDEIASSATWNARLDTATIVTWADTTASIATNYDISLKAPLASPLFTTQIAIGDAVINEAELEVLDGLTASRTELNYSSGVSSGIQAQLNALATKTGQIFTVNAFQYPVPGTEWTPTLSGANCPASQTAVLCWIPLNFLKVGDVITTFSIVGDATEINALTLDCIIYRINKADPLTQTALTNGTMTQVDAGGNFDVVVNVDDETVATDKQYVLQLTATTGIDDVITVIGAEVTISRK